MSSQVITGAFGFLLLLFLPRYLGTVDYGRLYLAISIQGIFQMFISFGGRYFIPKEVARDRTRTADLLVNSIAMRVVLWGVSMLAMILLGYIANYPVETRLLIMILGVAMLWEGIKLVLWCCFQGHEQMKYPVLGSILERSFVTGVGILALLLHADAVGIAIIMAVGSLLNFLVCMKFIPRIVEKFPKVDWRAAYGMLRPEVPYFLFSVFGVIYFRIDAVMLSLLTPADVVGWYGASYRLFDILMFLPSIFNIALFPVLARLWGNEKETLALTTQRSLELMLAAAIPIAVIIFAFAHEIIELFFGLNAYGPSVVLLQIFGLGVIIIYVNFVLGTTVFATDKQRQWTLVSFIAIFLNVGMNYFLIPYTQARQGNGGIGAAIATLLTELYILLSALVLIGPSVFQNAHALDIGKGIGSGIIMILAIWWTNSIDWPWLLQVAAASTIYIAALLSMRMFRPAEIAIAKELLTIRNLKSTFVPDKG
jgi:O-antigen/teichoic acid export membrane protein